jgi:hypothetical protein
VISHRSSSRQPTTVNPRSQPRPDTQAHRSPDTPGRFNLRRPESLEHELGQLPFTRAQPVCSRDERGDRGRRGALQDERNPAGGRTRRGRGIDRHPGATPTAHARGRIAADGPCPLGNSAHRKRERVGVHVADESELGEPHHRCRGHRLDLPPAVEQDQAGPDALTTAGTAIPGLLAPSAGNTTRPRRRQRAVTVRPRLGCDAEFDRPDLPVVAA